MVSGGIYGVLLLRRGWDGVRLRLGEISVSNIKNIQSDLFRNVYVS